MSNWLIRAVFSGWGCLGIRNTMVKSKMGKRHKSITGRKMLALPVWREKTGSDNIFKFTIVFTSRETPILRKRHELINYRQEYAGTSCLPSKTGSGNIFDFTIVFRIPGNPLHEKTAWNSRLPTGKCRHFLFGETGSEAISNFIITFCVPSNPYPEKTA